MVIDYSRYKALRIEKKGKVAVVTLNRPDALNAFDRTMHWELEDILEDVSKDDDIFAAVLTGSGKMFSCGGDIHYMEERIKNPKSSEITMDNVRHLVSNLVELEKPIIAALNGDAIGLGATVALFCDIIIMSEKARIADAHVKVGMVAGDGGCSIWPFIVGMHRAKEYLLSGDLIQAKEAERIGLVNYVLPAEDVLPKALSMAEKLANLAPKAVRWTKRCLNKHIKESVELIMDSCVSLEYHSMLLDDHKEAVDAFLNKRRPEFTGK